MNVKEFVNASELQVIDETKQPKVYIETYGCQMNVADSEIVVSLLKKEGYVRDIIRRVQTMRKELDLEYTQNIELIIEPDEFGSKAITDFLDFIKEETLAIKLDLGKPKEGLVK